MVLINPIGCFTEFSHQPPLISVSQDICQNPKSPKQHFNIQNCKFCCLLTIVFATSLPICLPHSPIPLLAYLLFPPLNRGTPTYLQTHQRQHQSVLKKLLRLFHNRYFSLSLPAHILLSHSILLISLLFRVLPPAEPYMLMLSYKLCLWILWPAEGSASETSWVSNSAAKPARSPCVDANTFRWRTILTAYPATTAYMPTPARNVKNSSVTMPR